MRTALLRLIRLYQVIVSPALGMACRYEPTCSHYAYEAIERHGAWRGARLAASRLGRCRPGGGGGYDPVPDTDLHPTLSIGAPVSFGGANGDAERDEQHSSPIHTHSPATDVSPR